MSPRSFWTSPLPEHIDTITAMMISVPTPS
jgi:hypothetical protein